MAMQELDYLQGARMASGGPPWSKDGPGMEVSSVWRDLVAQFHERANVGEEAPDFTGELLGGSSVSLRSYSSKRNVLLIFGSYTDPPCRSNLRLTRPSLVDLYRQYEKAVTFLWIYTREAHPGKLILSRPRWKSSAATPSACATRKECLSRSSLMLSRGRSTSSTAQPSTTRSS